MEKGQTVFVIVNKHNYQPISKISETNLKYAYDFEHLKDFLKFPNFIEALKFKRSLKFSEDLQIVKFEKVK